MGPERIREINSLRILHWLIDGSETTATEIAEHCDLSRTSVNAALANLHDLGWLTTLEAVTGTTLRIGTLPVQVAGNRHAEVHPTLPGPANRAYLIDGRVLVTGDEHPVPPDRLSALVTPVDAPWLRAADLIRYVRALRPKLVVGVHDGLLNADGLAVARHVIESLRNEGAARATILADGEAILAP